MRNAVSKQLLAWFLLGEAVCSEREPAKTLGYLYTFDSGETHHYLQPPDERLGTMRRSPFGPAYLAGRRMELQLRTGYHGINGATPYCEYETYRLGMDSPGSSLKFTRQRGVVFGNGHVRFAPVVSFEPPFSPDSSARRSAHTALQAIRRIAR